MKALNLRTLIAAVTAATALALTGCGGFSCSDKNKCTGQAPTQAEIDACNKEISDPVCGGKVKDFLTCAESNASCSADGGDTLDLNGTTCNTQFSDVFSCCEANPTAVACTGS